MRKDFRITRSHGRYKVGDIVSLPVNQGRVLIALRRAEEYNGKVITQSPVTKDVAPPPPPPKLEKAPELPTTAAIPPLPNQSPAGKNGSSVKPRNSSAKNKSENSETGE